MAAAEADGIHHNTIYQNPKFKDDHLDVVEKLSDKYDYFN